MNTDYLLIGAALLLFTSVLASKAADRFGFPALLLFLILALAGFGLLHSRLPAQDGSPSPASPFPPAPWPEDGAPRWMTTVVDSPAPGSTAPRTGRRSPWRATWHWPPRPERDCTWGHSLRRTLSSSCAPPTPILPAAPN